MAGQTWQASAARVFLIDLPRHALRIGQGIARTGEWHRWPVSSDRTFVSGCLRRHSALDVTATGKVFDSMPLPIRGPATGLPVNRLRGLSVRRSNTSAILRWFGCGVISGRATCHGIASNQSFTGDAGEGGESAVVFCAQVRQDVRSRLPPVA